MSRFRRPIPLATPGLCAIGDLANLYAPPSVAEDEPDGLAAAVHREIAVEALTGASIRERAQRRIERLEKRSIHDQVRELPASARPGVAASSFTARDLVRALGLRLKHKLRTGKSMMLR